MLPEHRLKVQFIGRGSLSRHDFNLTQEASKIFLGFQTEVLAKSLGETFQLELIRRLVEPHKEKLLLDDFVNDLVPLVVLLLIQKGNPAIFLSMPPVVDQYNSEDQDLEVGEQ